MQEPEKNKGSISSGLSVVVVFTCSLNIKSPGAMSVVATMHLQNYQMKKVKNKKQSTLACSCVLIQKLRINHDFRIESTNNTLHDV